MEGDIPQNEKSVLPSLVRGLLTTYCLTSSSLDKLKSLRILLALLGPRRRGTVLSVSPGMSFSPVSNKDRDGQLIKSEEFLKVFLAPTEQDCNSPKYYECQMAELAIQFTV